MTPQVSVLMPVRDAAGTVDVAIASVLQQTYTAIELVVVDDGSADDTWAIVAAWARRDPRVRPLRRGRRGLIDALNAGLEHCRAPLIARMDGDDVALPSRLERQVTWLARHPECGIVGCQVESFTASETGAPAAADEGYRLYDRWQNSLVTHEEMLRELFVESPLAHPSVLMRAATLAALGGYRDVGWPEDYDLWLRAAAAGVRLAKVPEVLLRWRDHAGRHSRTHGRYRRDAFIACKCEHLAKWRLDRARPVVIWGAGSIGRRFGKHLRTRGMTLAAFVDIDARKLGRRLHGAPVVAPGALGELTEAFVLAAVGTRGARQEICRALDARGRREGADYLCVA